MKTIRFLLAIIIFTLAVSCAPLDEFYSHEFSSGYYKLKDPGTNPEKVFVSLYEDSIVVYPVSGEGKSLKPEISKSRGIDISSINPGSYLYNNSFIRTSLDIDLSTVLLKYRPATPNVSSQLSTNVNGILYAGFRKDYFRMKTRVSPLSSVQTSVRHTGFDFGLFAGIGVTPVNPTVTMLRSIQEYDGIVFQKGFSIFATYENMSVGVAVGFDNLIGKDRNIWIYNQKPWIGLVLGIANF